MNIILGRAPDFVMKLGQVEIFHKVSVLTFFEVGRDREWFVCSDRSLWTVSRLVRSYFKSKKRICLNAIEFNTEERIMDFSIYVHKARISLATPVELLLDDKNIIQNKFLDYLKYIQSRQCP
jgi:hypothetical protein